MIIGIFIKEVILSEIKEMVKSVSRTFALSIQTLPKNIRLPVGLSYLLFRVSDCIEDNPDLAFKQKDELLQIWGQVLMNKEEPGVFTTQIIDLDSKDPEVCIAQKADDLIGLLHTFQPELQELIVTHCVNSALGMAKWQRLGPSIQTEQDLDDYMFHVAGLVGYLMTDIFSFFLRSIQKQKSFMLPLARQVGLGLQTVNIIRGIREDYIRGWIFVPESYMNGEGISREQFFLSEFEDKALAVINRLIDKAEKHLKYGLDYISAFPFWLHRVRLSCIWPLFFAIKTLAVSRDNPEVIRSEVKISRNDVFDIMRSTTLLGWSDFWLQRYYNKLNISKLNLSS
jgi:farnesyl-diphosphate farnesyltransferase